MGSQGALRELPLVHESSAFRRVLQLAQRVAATDHPVLIEGESGTGKARIARAIHQMSRRQERPLVIWSASEHPSTLAASTLFGVVKGAFTGADRTSAGALESADGGTFILDDVDKLDPSVQQLLLRFLDEFTIRKVGCHTDHKLDVRLIFTTNRNLEQLTQGGQFLSDFYWRIRGVRLEIPPLRKRMEDIRHLAEQMLKCFSSGCTDFRPFSPEALEVLQDHPWPGNVRELASVIQTLVVLGPSNGAYTGADLRNSLITCSGTRSREPQDELNRLRMMPVELRKSAAVIKEALELTRFNGRKAAFALNFPERSFRRYMKQSGLKVRDSSP